MDLGQIFKAPWLGKEKGRCDALQTLSANTSEAAAADVVPALLAVAGGREAEDASLLFLALWQCH